MPTKVSQFCEATMEAAWLVALILAPVFFNIYSSRIFEPDKISIVRSLAFIILAAWLVKLVEGGEGAFKQRKTGVPWFQHLLQIPLAVPVLALVAVYLLATVFSVTPRVSLWGSYQRLQGLYTTFSYLVIFASIAGNLRRRDQVRRLITVGILASLPVSLYGVVQRYKLDPIPWGGDVSLRIASNMGNSIFVAAFLVMVIPGTLVRIVEAVEVMFKEKKASWVDFTRLTVYLFIAALQLTSLYFTGSRGPWLGWAASMVFLWLGFSLMWRKRWMTISGVTLAGMAAVFLLILNIPGGPLEHLRRRPEFGRLGQLLDAESRTGRVRALIWQGAADLVFPHEPIEYPDGTKDRLNIFRPLLGYGPESMYVAYNPFYPPELTQVEKRNASPDRSHNETWDALVTTGLFGLVVYLALFGSVLYHGLKWLGLVQGRRQRNLFLGLFLGGGLVSSLAFGVWKGVPFLGVALPFGMIIGVMIYLIWSALRGQFTIPSTVLEKARAYILLGLLAALLAHFVEINFGIAIVSTRTYFWVYSALLISVGQVLPELGEFGRRVEDLDNFSVKSVLVSKEQPEGSQTKSERMRGRKSTVRSNRRKARLYPADSSAGIFNLPEWLRVSMMVGVMSAIILSTLGFLYITNASRSLSALGIIWNSVTRLKQTPQSPPSIGILSLVISTTLIGGVLLVSESTEVVSDVAKRDPKRLWKIFSIGMGISLLLALIFWYFHARGLIDLVRATANTIEEVMDQVRKSEQILTGYYSFILFFLLLLAYALVPVWAEKGSRLGAIGAFLASGALLVALLIAVYSNLRVIQADISFKTAELFARPSTWPVAIRIYERANDLAPNEDYYYLFLGRAYLEYARGLENASDRDRLIAQAAADLRKAQAINPLNPDHTANLARLHSLWALSTTDPAKRMEKAEISDDYFSRAVVLKPKDAKLWDEWALLYLNVLQQPDEALRRLNLALEIDPYYDWTHGLLGDYTLRNVAEKADSQSSIWQEAMQQSANYFKNALQYSDPNNTSFEYNYAISLAGIQVQLGQFEDATQTYELAIEILPDNSDNWKIHETLARLYIQGGDMKNAIVNAIAALETAPDDQKSRLQELVSSLGG